MLTQDANPAIATPAASGTSPKTLQLMRKRLRQLLRGTLVLASCLAIGATALAIWWLTSLNGLPDIGDPFDVAAFRALRIPDEQNAFVFLRRADQKLTPYPDLPRAVGLAAPMVSWSKADPKLRAWVEENRHALELFQQGAEQSDAIQDLTGDPLNFYGGVNAYGLTVLALLEGGKRQESGDTAGAWDCYRAVLRMTAHSIRRRSDVPFHNSQYLPLAAATPHDMGGRPEDHDSPASPRPERSGQDRANAGLGFVALKILYLEIMRSLEQPMDPLQQQELEGASTYRLGDMELSADIIGYTKAARRFLLREPERSRRVVKLLCANWLAHVEEPELPPRKPAVRALLTALKPCSVALYPVSPRCACRSPHAITAGSCKLAGHNPRRQAANPVGEQSGHVVATESTLPQSTSGTRHHAGDGNLSS